MTFTLPDQDRTPRAYTVEETRAHFLDHVAVMVKYWDELPEIDRATGRRQDQRDRLEGLAFSILSALDGSSMAVPAFIVAPDPHPEDMAYRISELTNYYPEGPEAECDIAGSLHELIHRHFEKFPRQADGRSDTPE